MISSLRKLTRPHRRGVPAHLSSLLLLLQRSPLLKLLPEARIISTSGFTEAVRWTVTAIAGLGAFDAVSGVTTVSQTSPVSGSPNVNVTGGAFMNFAWTVLEGASATLSTWTIAGTLPAGLVHADLEQSRTNFISGVPVQVGSFPVSITVWEFADASGRSVTGDFTINVAAPPAPAISAHPPGGNFTEGAFVMLTATQTSGFQFLWKKDDQPLSADSTILIPRTAPRRYFVPTTTGNIGTTWRTGAAFNDSTWTAVSGGIGYDVNPSPVNYVPEIAAGGNTQTLMRNTGRTSAYVRIPFTMTGSTPISNLKLRVQCDDGFVAWLNGTEVASQNRLANVLFNSPAGNLANDAQAITFREFEISRSSTALRAGENILAIQAMNEDTGSSDFLFNCELEGGTNDATHTRRLIIPAVTSNQAGSYTLTITNPTGTVTSNPAVLVLPPQIEGHPLPVEIQNGATATLTVEALISPPWTYQWYRGESGDITNPMPEATGISFTTPPLTQSERYWVRVSNPAGHADSNAALVSIAAAIPPGITGQPPSPEIDAGTTATLTVTAGGDPPLTYQWYNGPAGDESSPIPDAIAPTFTTPALFAPASYWVRLTNPAGTLNSDTANVTIRAPFLTWKNDRFTPAEAADDNIAGPAADPDTDGTTNEREYIFGTDPKTPELPLLPAIAPSGQSATLTFTARPATGPGYAARTRHYTIETTADLTTGPWQPLPGFTDIPATGQEITAPLPVTPRTFARLRVSLNP